MKKPHIITAHGTLRLAELFDVPKILQFYQENEFHLAPWEPERPVDFLTEDYWQKQIIKAEQEFVNGVSARLGYFEKSNGACIGFVNLTNFERGPFQNCRLGYKIAKSHEGLGAMSQALRHTIAYAFGELAFHRIEANVIPHNSRSLNLLKRLGFVEHGIARNYLKINGTWQDHVLTSLVKES